MAVGGTEPSSAVNNSAAGSEKLLDRSRGNEAPGSVEFPLEIKHSLESNSESCTG